MASEKSLMSEQVVQTLADVDAAIAAATALAEEHNILPTSMQTMDGEFIMAPLLLARATCLSTLVAIRSW